MALRSLPVKPTRLADTLRLGLPFDDRIPHSWRTWQRDFSYWNGELDADG